MQYSYRFKLPKTPKVAVLMAYRYDVLFACCQELLGFPQRSSVKYDKRFLAYEINRRMIDGFLHWSDINKIAMRFEKPFISFLSYRRCHRVFLERFPSIQDSLNRVNQLNSEDIFHV